MKKHTINIITLFMSFICLGVQAMPVYTDDIPQDYLKKVNSLKKHDTSREYATNISEKNIVKVYTPEHIVNKPKIQKINGISYIVSSLKVNDKVNFMVAEDVEKNGQIYIKKGTQVTGLIRTSEIGLPQYLPPGVIEISYFSTKDVKGNNVDLYGKIIEEAPDFQLILIPGIPFLNPAIKRNKIYTLYYK